MPPPRTKIDDFLSLVLTDLGLNEYEKKAYLTILEGGVVVAREISDRSGIPYAKVYQILDSLNDKQLISSDEGRPRKFKSIHPEESLPERLSFLKNDWNRIHDQRVSNVAKILPGLISLYKETTVADELEEGVWMISGLPNIISRFNKIVKVTHKRIIISSSNKPLIDKLIQNINNKDLSIILRTNTQFDTHNKKFKHIVSNELGNATFVIFDDSSMMSIVEPNDSKDYTGVLTQISEIIKSYLIDFSKLLEVDL